MTASAAVTNRHRSFGDRLRDALLAYGMLAPALVIFALFVFYPFARNFWLGSYIPPLVGTGEGTYVGYDRWRVLLDFNVLLPAFGVALLVGVGLAVIVGIGLVATKRRRVSRLLGPSIAIIATVTLTLGCVLFIRRSDSDFAASLETTLKFWLYTVPPVMVIGTLLAVLGQRLVKGIGVFRTLFMMSLATGVGVAGVIFFTLFNPNVGFLPWLGLDVKPQVFFNSTWALPGVALFAVWVNIGLAFIVLSAGMQSIPDDLYESARVDGAGSIRCFWRITIPMLSPTLLFVFVLASITALIQSFPYVDVTTGGKAVLNTQTVPALIVQNARGGAARVPDSGAAAVYSVALFAIALVLTVIQLLVLERRVHYGDDA